jgi:hypothetical protein
MIPQRISQRSHLPKYAYSTGVPAFNFGAFQIFHDRDLARFSFVLNGVQREEWHTGLIDLIIELFSSADYVPSEREVHSFLRDDAYQDFPQIGSDSEQFVKELINLFSQFIAATKKEQLNWSNASIVDKVSVVKGLIATHYSKIELIDVDDDLIVVSIGDSGKCEGDKILESLQDYLQNHLKSNKINVIPEF